MSVLVVGGAGYIGSHMVACLKANRIPCVVLDNLSTGFIDSIANFNVPFVEGCMAGEAVLERTIVEHEISSVMHFAAFSQVGESMLNPAKYFHNNLVNSLVLLDVMNKHGVKNFVFSSTAAVYGLPQQEFIDEGHPVHPINPYGHSKLSVEWLLQDYAKAYNIRSVCLRYFNAAGAQPDATNGERHNPETHLIPLVLQAASGRREQISIFGNDYNTPDGTCVRDYIHVLDLADAHLLALNWLRQQTGEVFRVFNLGNGNGFSVKQLISAAERVTGNAIKVELAERRQGDPDRLVASSDLARRVLSWQPVYCELEEIIRHAWQWELKHGQLWDV